jgi:hypothetical protein
MAEIAGLKPKKAALSWPGAGRIVMNLDTSTWDPALDAVVAAPANHKVLFENDHLRVLEVNLAPDEEEPTHHHRWRSVFVLEPSARASS